MADVSIREATEKDLREILAIYAELDNGQVLDVSAARSIFERIQRYPNYAIYIAELEGQAVGTFALLIMDNLAHMGTSSGVVEDVVVRSRWRGRGVGKAMMRHAMTVCREEGCYKLTLSSNLAREAAHRFYESLGFERHGYSFVVDWTE